MALITVIAAYDITADSRRSAVAALLQSYGDRIQKSVFALTITAEELEEVRARATVRMNLDEDSLYIFGQCATCWSGLEFIGQAEPPAREFYWAVL